MSCHTVHFQNVLDLLRTDIDMRWPTCITLTYGILNFGYAVLCCALLLWTVPTISNFLHVGLTAL